ncbi:MAG TPA: AAA family ATPase [Polyangia bacterium]|jgi:predicted ATPase|nr:AAA family ATPase [Polyangia bacterium]
MFIARGYETTQTLYESTNSIIYRARRQGDQRSVILKVLKAVEPPPEVIARFKREYMLTRGLALPGVVEVYDFLQTANHWVIVEEDFGGESLARLGLAGKISIQRFLDLAIEVTGILGMLHQKRVIHKDINPSNIVQNPETQVVKFIDFGISSSKLPEETVAFEHPTLLEGTPGYLSPEQTGRLNRPLDYRTDFYSLGCTFYVLLTGELPFPTDDLLELVHSHLARVPNAPHELRPEIPPSLSAIVLKLMAKNPDERYQSAHGLKVDLNVCQQEQTQSVPHAVTFDLGQDDVTTHFRLPARLYGRDREIERLLTAFDRVSAGETGLMLVTGYSGIGKSALVKELYGPITRRKGFFVAGKFEQYERNLPYAPIVEAFRALIHQLLCESQAQITCWRDKLLQALGPSCGVLIEVIPPLELITGPLPPPPPLPPGDTHFRFMRAIREFLRVFAQPEHPLVLFLDDLQWSDSASLDFIKSLTTSDKVPHLFIIGAYRDNEVGEGHPLALVLKDIEIAAYLRLSPLGLPDVTRMIADTFRVAGSRAEGLAVLVHGKTGGNPFFLGELFKALHAEDLVYFQHETGTWEWDVERIRTRDITDNVVELLIGKLHRLAPETQALLKWAACVGNRFDLNTLMIICDRQVHQVPAALMPALSEGFVLPLSGNYRLLEADVESLEQRLQVDFKFAHDRIQQAAYTLIPEAVKKEMHLSIGRRLQQERPRELLRIVNQLNIAGDLVTDLHERFEIARLNLQAGEKARDSAAYESAFKFLIAGLSFLSPPSLDVCEPVAIRCADAAAYAKDYKLCLKLTEKAAEAAYLSGRFESMEQLAENGLAHARGWEDKVEIYQVKINALTAQSRPLDAIDMAREILRHMGVSLPKEPGQAEIDEAIREVDRVLGGRLPKSLIDLPRAASTMPHGSALRILDNIHMTTSLAQQALGPIVAAKMVQLTLLYGRTDESINGYTFYGMHLCGQDKIEQGYEFGQLARVICEKEKSRAQFAEVCASGCYWIFHWKEPISSLIEDLKKGYRAGLDTGRLSVAINDIGTSVVAPFIAGFELEGVEEGIRQTIAVGERLKQGFSVNWLRAFWQCALNFMRDYEDPGALKGEAYDEDEHIPIHRANRESLSIQLVHILKIWLCYRFGKYREAVASYTSHVENKYPKAGILLPPTTMYYCLARLALYAETEPNERETIVRDTRRTLEQMRTWATHGPMNYGHKYHLVEAELARVLGQESIAREHYDQAIDLAHEYGYLNEESLALERAGLFFQERGQLRLAGYYLRDADYVYQRWGAAAKRNELRRRFPDLLVARNFSGQRYGLGASGPSVRREAKAAPAPGSRDTVRTGDLPDLDLETVLRASRAISAEDDPTRLLEQTMSICLKHAGARRGFLILARGDELIVKAKGVLHEREEIQLISEALRDQDDLSHGIVHYVARTSEPVLLDNAAEEGLFQNDPYVRQSTCQSVLCIPIVYQGTLVGITYMENNSTPGAFKAERLEVLNLLMAQAAISIENALLRRADLATEFQFAVGGSLAAGTPSYVLREADRELSRRIQRSELCYVFNARQMGKSSLRVHAMGELGNRGMRCAAIDLTSIGSGGVNVDQWYAGVARSMIASLDLGREFNLRDWWRDRAFLSPVQRLSELVDEVVLRRIAQPVVIFIDEIDTVLSLDFPLDDFFALIRLFYNKRADDARYERLTFVLLGVATPTDLILDKARTPFNIGHAIPMAGFSYMEAKTLARGLAGIGNPELVLKAILIWTDGQPFLTQKLCQLASLAESRPPAGKEREWVANLVQEKVIDKWRVRDEPEHLKTIEARLLQSPNREGLLKLYRKILVRGGVATRETPLESELVLAGLVTRQWGKLRVGNLVYASIFDGHWLAEATAQAYVAQGQR